MQTFNILSVFLFRTKIANYLDFKSYRQKINIITKPLYSKSITFSNTLKLLKYLKNLTVFRLIFIVNIYKIQHIFKTFLYFYLKIQYYTEIITVFIHTLFVKDKKKAHKKFGIGNWCTKKPFSHFKSQTRNTF